MKQKKMWTAAARVLAVVAVTLLMVLILAPSTTAQENYKVLYTFTGGADGAYPELRGGLIFDAAGNLFGTNVRRGNPGNWNGQGVVFKLTRGSDGNWTGTSPYIFCLADWNICSDGAYPTAALRSDKVGNLYGATGLGGIGSCFNDYIYGCGVIFKLAPNFDGSWTYTPLYKFNGGIDGTIPVAPLIFDSIGNLYGTATGGGVGYGVVFELMPNPDGSWTQKVLHAFEGNPAKYPYSRVVFDEEGNLYGTTYNGGPADGGVVYKLAPNPDGSWTFSVLHVFVGKPAMHPYGGLVFDAAGNLYGATAGGGPQNAGVVFKLATAAGGKWTYSVLHTFNGKNGGGPWSELIFDSSGNLYGTTSVGGLDSCSSWAGQGCGVVFELTPSSDGKWREQILHKFTGDDGFLVISGLSFDAVGNLYGATDAAFSSYGVVFEISPSFRPAASPASVTVSPGQSATSTVKLTPLVNFKGTVNLSCTAPSVEGLGCAVSTGSLSLDGKNLATATLTVNTSSTTPAGTYKIKAKGVSGTLAYSTTFTLTVQ